MAKSIRILTEFRLMAVLSHCGVLAPVRGVYRAHRGRDTRSQPAGWVSPHIVSRMQAQGLLKPHAQFAGRFMGAGAGMAWLAEAPVRRPADMRTRPLRAGRDLAGQLFAQAAEPGMIRQKAAAGRFRDEFRQASQPVMQGLRPVHGKTAARLPSAGLAALEAQLGLGVMRQLEDMLIDRATLTALLQRWSEEPGRVRELAMAALKNLAEAYQLSPAAETPSRASLRIRSSMEASPFDR